MTTRSRDVIEQQIAHILTMPQASGWQQRHIASWNANAHPIVGLIKNWATYADTHETKYGFGATLGNDSFLGPAWRDIGLALRTLLNGDCGALDCGTLDATLVDIAAANGLPFDP